MIPLHKGLYRWTSDGKLLKKLNQEWSKNTLDKVLAKPSDPNFYRLSYLKLSIESKKRFYSEIEDLVNKYVRLSSKEKIEKKADLLEPISLLMALSQSGFI